MKRIMASLNRFFHALGRLIESAIDANGTGRGLMAAWGPVSIDNHIRRYPR